MIAPSGNGTKIVEFSFFVGHGDQLPISVSGRHLDSEDRGGLLVGGSRCGRRGNDNAGQRSNCSQQESDPFHKGASFQISEHHIRVAGGVNRVRSLTSSIAVVIRVLMHSLRGG